MQKIKLFSLLLLMPLITLCQNLTGTWEGSMGDQFLQVNIMHTTKGLCGYTYDYVYAQQRNSCRAYFTASWSAKKNLLKIKGTSMFENSGTHTLMQLSLEHSNGADGEYLTGTESPKSVLLKIMTLGSPTTFIRLKKVSNIPAPYFKDMFKACVEDTLKVDTLVKVKPIEIKKDTLIVSTPNVKVDTTKSIEKEMVERKSEVLQVIKTNAPKLNIKMYDNGTIDGDTVTVFHNGKMLATHQVLSEKAFEINIDINKDNPRHEIILFAENLGSIPPNTALLIIETGGKRYELRAAADLNKNATLVFEYNPEITQK